MITQAVILAAGRGTRLGNLSQHYSKAMVPIVGKPMLFRVMDEMLEAGITRFVIVVGENTHEISSYCESHPLNGVDIEIALQNSPIGTADALVSAAPFIDGDFLLSSVDNLVEADALIRLISHFNESKDNLTFTLLPASVTQIQQSAEILLEGQQVVAITEKPIQPQTTHASIFLYACQPFLLDYARRVQTSVRSELEIQSAFQQLLNDRYQIGTMSIQRRFHLTYPEDILALTLFVFENRSVHHIGSPIPSSVTIKSPVWIEENVTIEEGATIGPLVVLSHGVSIGKQAVLSDCVIMENIVISPHERISHQVISGRTS